MIMLKHERRSHPDSCQRNTGLESRARWTIVWSMYKKPVYSNTRETDEESKYEAIESECI